jgi:hypothetical protein
MNSKQYSTGQFGTPRQIPIAPDIFFLVPDARFAILLFRVSRSTPLEMFSVTMSRESMAACRNALPADEIQW